MPQKVKLAAVPRALTESDAEWMIGLAEQHARLIDELEAAVKNEDRDLCWRIACAICAIEDRVREKGPAA
jgi:hypothetical protein